jgi:hypothetical protein
VTFRYRNAKTGRLERRMVSGAQFLCKRPADPPVFFCLAPARLSHLGVWWRWRRDVGRNSGERMLRRGIEVM